MTIVEQAEHELRLLMLCKPSTARALIDEVKRLRAELDAANALVKRYEAALEWMSQEQHSIHSYSYDCGNSYGVYSNGDRRYISEAKSTPLDAIEAATKERE